MIEIDLILDDDLAPEFPGLEASGLLRILQGDALEQLRILPAQSVQCCVSSPPYWGLRDYGTAAWAGGDAGCEHKAGSDYGTKNDTNNGAIRGGPFKTHCGKCGARRIDSQLGLEERPEEYIAKMVAVFREVKRVLRDDGTFWLNLGDSYSSGDRTTTTPNGLGAYRNTVRPAACGMKPKDLCMMPARLAMALQADGWYLRSEIVWSKPNPMPESVTDRPTKAHEMIYLLAKQERYFYEAEAIREPLSEISIEQIAYYQKNGSRTDISDKKFDESRNDSGGPLNTKGRGARGSAMSLNGRNKRTVWTIATQPYAEAHFATFPEEIPKLCILAGSRPGDTVLDPFAGSGTVGKVALELGRKAVLIELNPKYVQLIEDRTRITIGMF